MSPVATVVLPTPEWVPAIDQARTEVHALCVPHVHAQGGGWSRARVARASGYNSWRMPPTKIRVGIVGFGHMHINDVMRQFAELDEVQLVAAADTVAEPPEVSNATFTRAWNARYAQESIGIRVLYPTYQEMLEREQFDVVLVYCEIARHAEVVEAVARYGCRIVVEKPMADTMANGLRIVRAAREAGIDLFVNWPSTWMPAVRMAYELLASGAIGRVLGVKYRGGHTGPLGAGAQHQGVAASASELTDQDRSLAWWYRAGTGGGALLDYASYGACLAYWFFGEPASAVTALAANLGHPYATVEDNAVVVVRFPSGMAVCEASWTQIGPGITPGPIVYGERGTLVVQRSGGRSWIEIQRSGSSDAVEVVEPRSLPVGRQNIAQEVVSCVRTGVPMHETLSPGFNLQPMAILDAAVRSVSSGRVEPVEVTSPAADP